MAIDGGAHASHATNGMKDRPALATARLMLRRPEVGDIASIVAIAGDWQISSRLGRVPYPYSEQDAHAFLREIVPNEWTWAITLRVSGEFVGVIGLHPEEPDVAELGYYVARRHWGRGIATEAVLSIIHYGQSIGLRRIIAGHFVNNPASGRVLQKAGFVEIGRTERSCLASGITMPSIEMEIVNGIDHAGRGISEGL